MNREKMMSGQLIFRESREEVKNEPNKKLMMVIGVVAVPKDFDIKGEHKYTIVGERGESTLGVMGIFNMVDPSFSENFSKPNEITIKLFTETAENLSDETIGDSPSGIITRHNKWRV